MTSNLHRIALTGQPPEFTSLEDAWKFAAFQARVIANLMGELEILQRDVRGKATGDDYVTKALFNANTVIAADTDDTPAAVTVAEDRLVGRLTGGSIAALTAAQFKTLVGLDDGALDLYCRDLRVKNNVGFFDTAPIAQPSALTAKDNSTVDTTYGAQEADVINNNRQRIDELETKLQSLGLLA